MEYRIRKIGEPNLYEYLQRYTKKKEWEEFSDLDRRINAFFLYLQLSGQVIINNQIVTRFRPLDEEIEKALEILSRKF